MPFNLRNRNFLKELDFTPQEIEFLLDLSIELKKAKYSGTEQQRLKGKNIALIFEKASILTMREEAGNFGFQGIRQDAVRKALTGITTLQEITRMLG